MLCNQNFLFYQNSIMLWNSITILEFHSIKGIFIGCITKIQLHSRIWSNYQYSVTSLEVSYITRIQFSYIRGVLLDWNSVIKFYYVMLENSITWPEFCYITLLEFCYIMEFHHITGNPLDYITGIPLHHWNYVMLPEFNCWHYVCQARNT